MRYAPWIFAALLTTLSANAGAVQLIVFKAKGIDLARGSELNSSDRLKLVPGQEVTLITDDGRTIHLKGPLDRPPLAAGGKGKQGHAVFDALKSLVAPKRTDKASLGVMRDAGIGKVRDTAAPKATAPTRPDPWALDIGHSGDQCILAAHPLVLWRREPGQAGRIRLTLPQRRLEATTTWPAGYDRVQAPKLKLHEGDTLHTALGTIHATIRVHVIPSRATAGKQRAAWALAAGCRPQARLLARKAAR